MSENISVSVENMTLGFIAHDKDGKGTMNKAMIYAGSRINSLEEKKWEEGDSKLFLNNSMVLQPVLQSA